MFKLAGAGAVSIIAMSTSAIAGDQVLYEDLPSWVEDMALDLAKADAGQPIVLADRQVSLERGEVWEYVDMAVKLDTPQALTTFGTLTARWLPDKGDLYVHRAQLLRNGETIGLLEGEQQFDILRREAGLESRLLDGVLTATMPVNGAQIGDVVRLSYSTTISDQALGDNVQWSTPLPTRPARIGNGRVIVSWPQTMQVSRFSHRDDELPQPVLEEERNVWTVDLPLPQQEDRPGDAPLRCQIPPLMQIGSYESWTDVSRLLAPHYVVNDTIKPDGEIAAKIARIGETTSNREAQAALALQLVQDTISYLMNGLEGGNYLPQMPEETWNKRFGDRKAKSVLLLAILRELGIESEVVLVRSKAGDALPMLAPLPANFDHMIVHATIDGERYWLDGTSSGSRLATIDEVPRFFYALSIREDGADLMAMEERAQSVPDSAITITFDQTAGLRVPALVDVEIAYRGQSAAMWQSLAEQSDEERLEGIVNSTVSQRIGETSLTDFSVDFDENSGIATITDAGLRTTTWRQDNTLMQLDAPGQSACDMNFDSDRSRTEWRDIPLRLNGPVYQTSRFTMLLPAKAEPYRID